MRKLISNDPVELINQLIECAERELQDTKRPSLTESSRNTTSELHHGMSPRNAAISSRFASFTSAPPLLMTASLPERAAEAPPVVSCYRNRASSGALSSEASRDLFICRNGEYSSAAQLVAICFLDSIAIIDDDLDFDM
ncbi:hypothetical protein PINS_up009139 [Pythium insidiosum]|nr:hypothetical protein PINS_up009139 [Pythium insidiosum]